MTVLVEPVHGSVSGLSDREVEVLALLARGWSNGAMAQALVLSHRTVEAHITRIFLKLGLFDEDDRNRRVLAALAFHGVGGQSSPSVHPWAG